jgi:hypothetical protein
MKHPILYLLHLVFAARWHDSPHLRPQKLIEGDCKLEEISKELETVVSEIAYENYFWLKLTAAKARFLLLLSSLVEQQMHRLAWHSRLASYSQIA